MFVCSPSEVTGHRVVLFVDDFLCRGTKKANDDFYAALMSRFDCKDPTYLSESTPIVFVGLELKRVIEGGVPVNVMSQSREIEKFFER